MRRLAPVILVLIALLAAGCATLQGLAELRSVRFEFERVSQVRVAGVALTPTLRFSDLSLADVGRLTAAVAAREVPLECVAHVAATNPADNTVAARLVRLDWTLFVDQRSLLAGEVAEPVRIAPGATIGIPVAVRFDLVALSGGGARELLELAQGLAGRGPVTRDLRLELVPHIETPLGPLRYPAPVVVRRAADTPR